MANELHVLFSGKVPTKAALTRAMRELAFPVTIPAGGKPLAQQSGYLPMKLAARRAASRSTSPMIAASSRKSPAKTSIRATSAASAFAGAATNGRCCVPSAPPPPSRN